MLDICGGTVTLSSIFGLSECSGLSIPFDKVAGSESGSRMGYMDCFQSLTLFSEVRHGAEESFTQVPLFCFHRIPLIRRMSFAFSMSFEANLLHFNFSID